MSVLVTLTCLIDFFRGLFRWTVGTTLPQHALPVWSMASAQTVKAKSPSVQTRQRKPSNLADTLKLRYIWPFISIISIYMLDFCYVATDDISIAIVILLPGPYCTCWKIHYFPFTKTRFLLSQGLLSPPLRPLIDVHFKGTLLQRWWFCNQIQVYTMFQAFMFNRLNLGEWGQIVVKWFMNRFKGVVD